MAILASRSIATYRPPTWSDAPGIDRPNLRGLVGEALQGYTPVPVTHDSAGDIARRLHEGFQVKDSYRAQLERFGSIEPGEPLKDTVFAAVELQPAAAAQPVLGVTRYGDVTIHWNPKLLAPPTTISPIITGGTGSHGGGLHAGGSSELAEVLTDTLIAQHTSAVGVRRWGGGPLYDAVRLPHDQAVSAVRALFDGDEGMFHQLAPEAILRGAAPSRDTIDAISVLTSTPSPELTEVRDWAAKAGVPVLERPRI